MVSNNSYTEHQTSKFISRYGGVGSIIETIKGAIKIDFFDKWTYFQLINKWKIKPETIEEERLQNRLKHFFPNLEQFIKIPENNSTIFGSNLPSSFDKLITAHYFPEWFYCNKCNRLHKISDWWQKWSKVYKNPDPKIVRNTFYPPKCGYCYEHEKLRIDLEQVRFILTAPNGAIRDLPWDKWTLAEKIHKSDNNSEDSKNNEIENEEGSIKLPIDNIKCCDKQQLKYIKSDKFADFSGVRIKCDNPDCQTKGKQVTLAGLFGLRLFCAYAKDKEGNRINKNGKELKIFYKPVIRTSNSVYYPLITTSLFIPSQSLSYELKTKIKGFHEDLDLSAEEIFEKLKTKNSITLQQIKEIVEPNSINKIEERDYRLTEYNFLKSQPNPNTLDLNYFDENASNLAKYGIDKVLKIKRLKMTSVQTGFTRQEPLDKDLFDDYNEEDKLLKGNIFRAQYTSSLGKNTKQLPAVESFGEGIFINFDNSKIDKWFDSYWNENEQFAKRIQILQKNARANEFMKTEEKVKMIDNEKYLSKFVLLHTFSHLLIKELEFSVGYPATSISERLYIDNNEMSGILLYTIAGTEGSYGGLIAQAASPQLGNIIESALARAKDCASDPICYHSDGQGIGGLNLAACYSCALLPETSCEELNSYLDRAMLIDSKYGFNRKM